MKHIYIGIYPGLNGGLAAICEGGLLDAIKMPIIGNELDISTLDAWTERLLHQGPEYNSLHACIEDVHSMPGNGSSSSFKFGFITGALHGYFRAKRIPLAKVTPQKWQKATCGPTKGDKSITAKWVARMYPGAPIIPNGCRVPHDGITDAIAIADWSYNVITIPAGKP